MWDKMRHLNLHCDLISASNNQLHCFSYFICKTLKSEDEIGWKLCHTLQMPFTGRKHYSFNLHKPLKKILYLLSWNI